MNGGLQNPPPQQHQPRPAGIQLLMPTSGSQLRFSVSAFERRAAQRRQLYRERQQQRQQRAERRKAMNSPLKQVGGVELDTRQVPALQATLDGARRADPLDHDFVCRFNGFVAEDPRLLERYDASHRTLLNSLYWYLRHTLDRKFPLATFQALVIQTPQVLAEKGKHGLMLLHYACRHNPTALDIVSFFVQQYPDAAKARTNAKRTPLHIACRNKEAPLPVIRVLVDAYPRAIEIADKHGNAPVHYACQRGGAPLDVVRYLVMKKPQLCLRRNKNGDLPFDKAKGGSRHGGDAAANAVIEFMTTATTAAARALMTGFCFRGPAPREIFEQAATFLRGGQPVEASAVVLALSPGEIAVLFRRDDIQEEFSRANHLVSKTP